MGRPYQEKFANIKWEVNEEHFNAWKEGKTGVPIVDAGMRQLNTMGKLVLRPETRSIRMAWDLGWMHNRVRMIVAMYLAKDLMLDWRLGEKVCDPISMIFSLFTKIPRAQYFSKMLVDADLASNNGGWQWSAGTGTDPQPYFRIFNPYNQSEKVCRALTDG